MFACQMSFNNAHMHLTTCLPASCMQPLWAPADTSQHSDWLEQLATNRDLKPGVTAFVVRSQGEPDDPSVKAVCEDLEEHHCKCTLDTDEVKVYDYVGPVTEGKMVQQQCLPVAGFVVA